jgi:hypothetical protein
MQGYVFEQNKLSLNLVQSKVKFGARGGVVVEVLRYKSEGRGFDS